MAAVVIVKHNEALIRGDGIDIEMDVEEDGFVTLVQDEDVICFGHDEAVALYEALEILLAR